MGHLGPNWAQKWVFGWYLEFGSFDSSDIAYFDWFQRCLTVNWEFLVCSKFLGPLLAHLRPNWACIGPKNGFLADILTFLLRILLILHILIDCNDFQLSIQIFLSGWIFCGFIWLILGLKWAKNGVLTDISSFCHLTLQISKIPIYYNGIHLVLYHSSLLALWPSGSLAFQW